jgi:photosystem II stability/assembly factor-like uncharacterized protein
MTLLTASGISYALNGPLERPAQLSPRAQHAVLVAVTSAGNRLVAAGERGVVVLSDDDGATWRQAQVPVSVTLTAASFINPKEGWIVGHGGVVLHSRDGGETWIKQLDGNEIAQALLSSAKERSAKGDGDSKVFAEQLENAQRFVKDGPDKPLLDVHFVNARTGFIVGAYNLILRTDDGGQTWNTWQAHVDNPQGFHLYALGGSGPDLYIVGEQGSIFRSTDGGQSFFAVPAPYKGSFFGLLAEPGGSLVAFGLRGNAYQSSDNGSTWKKVDLGSNASVTGGSHLKDDGLVLVTQSGQILTSHDHGSSFQAVPISQPMSFAAAVQAANGDLILVGEGGVRTLSHESLAGRSK